jgi:exosortase
MTVGGWRGWFAGGLLVAAFFGAFLPPLVSMIETWWSIPDYSHGFFVLPIALYLAWSRRETLPVRSRPAVLVGLVVLVISLAASLFGTLAHIRPMAQYPMVPALAGVMLVVGGRRLFWWSLPMVTFLLFAIPLPHSLASHLALPLQHFGARGAAYLLETAGVPALADGTYIELENAQLNVAFACSGLQMVISFGAVCTAIALLSSYGPLGKFMVIASAVPIAMGCNVLRIALISWAHRYELVPPKEMHDAGGILIVPLTIALVFLGMFLFEKCFPLQAKQAHV